MMTVATTPGALIAMRTADVLPAVSVQAGRVEAGNRRASGRGKSTWERDLGCLPLSVQGAIMDFTISEEDRLLQQSVRGFVEEQANAVWKEIEKTAEIPQHLIDGMKELGLFGLSIPPEYGGLGFSVVQKALVHEMMGRGPWGLASFLSVHTGIGCVGIVRFANAAQKQKYLPKMATGEWIGSFALTEPGAGSDAGAIQSKAERKGDHYVLNGRKVFITNAPKAHHFFLFAKTDKGISA